MKIGTDTCTKIGDAVQGILKSQVDGLNEAYKYCDKTLAVSIAMSIGAADDGSTNIDGTVTYTKQKVKLPFHLKVREGQDDLFSGNGNKESAAGKFQNITNPLNQSLYPVEDFKDAYHWLIGRPLAWDGETSDLECTPPDWIWTDDGKLEEVVPALEDLRDLHAAFMESYVEALTQAEQPDACEGCEHRGHDDTVPEPGDGYFCGAGLCHKEPPGSLRSKASDEAEEAKADDRIPISQEFLKDISSKVFIEALNDGTVRRSFEWDGKQFVASGACFMGEKVLSVTAREMMAWELWDHEKTPARTYKEILKEYYDNGPREALDATGQIVTFRGGKFVLGSRVDFVDDQTVEEKPLRTFRLSRKNEAGGLDFQDIDATDPFEACTKAGWPLEECSSIGEGKGRWFVPPELKTKKTKEPPVSSAKEITATEEGITQEERAVIQETVAPSNGNGIDNAHGCGSCSIAIRDEAGQFKNCGVLPGEPCVHRKPTCQEWKIGKACTWLQRRPCKWGIPCCEVCAYDLCQNRCAEARTEQGQQAEARP